MAHFEVGPGQTAKAVRHRTRKWAMRITAWVGALLLASVTVSASGQVWRMPGHFRIVLTRSDGGWSARCDTGCAWHELSVSCPSECLVLIDTYGVSTNATSARGSVSFAFVLRPTRD